jgi:hypothetical protein
MPLNGFGMREDYFALRLMDRLPGQGLHIQLADVGTLFIVERGAGGEAVTSARDALPATVQTVFKFPGIFPLTASSDFTTNFVSCQPLTYPLNQSFKG